MLSWRSLSRRFLWRLLRIFLSRVSIISIFSSERYISHPCGNWGFRYCRDWIFERSSTEMLSNEWCNWHFWITNFLASIKQLSDVQIWCYTNLDFTLRWFLGLKRWHWLNWLIINIWFSDYIIKPSYPRFSTTVNERLQRYKSCTN